MKLFVICFMCWICCSAKENIHKPEQGIFTLTITNDEIPLIFKTLYSQSKVTVTYACSKQQNISMSLDVKIIGTTCKGMFMNDRKKLDSCFISERCEIDHEAMQITESAKFNCIQKETDVLWSKKWIFIGVKARNDTEDHPLSLSKRDAASENQITTSSIAATTTSTTTTTTTTTTTSTTTTSASTTTTKAVAQNFVVVPFMGEYVVQVTLTGPKQDKRDTTELPPVNVVVDMKSDVGYLSADEYPLLTFYAVMCAVYVLYTVLWLIMSICNCHDLLRVQYWIGGVILLGLIEKAVYVWEFNIVNQSGLSNRQMEKLAGFVSCFKRAVSRMLVIIVSLGFGIVKPRLGPRLYQVLGVGFIYFIVALLIQMFEIDVYFNADTREGWIVMYVPLAIIDVFISYWIFKSLLQTLKTLRLRRNTAKLSLYRHFANTIVFCALVSFAMTIYIIYYHELGCSEDFANNWFETACWPLLFSVILLVIMVLWRPTANNKRYAYSPMIDGDDSENEDMEEPMLGNGATESMKIRGLKKSEYVKSDIDMTDEALQWIDDNIPPTVADAALPVIMDPAEVKKATKYEMSKMD